MGKTPHPPASTRSLSEASGARPGWHHLCAWGWGWGGGSSLTPADALQMITPQICMPAVRPGDMIDTWALGGGPGLQMSVLSVVPSLSPVSSGPQSPGMNLNLFLSCSGEGKGRRALCPPSRDPSPPRFMLDERLRLRNGQARPGCRPRGSRSEVSCVPSTGAQALTAFHPVTQMSRLFKNGPPWPGGRGSGAERGPRNQEDRV